MPLAHVQSRGALSSGAVSSLALAFLSDLSEGNMIVVHGGKQSITGTPSVSDTAGHSFTEHPNSPSNSEFGNASHAMWWNVDVNGGADTVTFTCGTSVVAAITISEYSGQETSGQPNTSAVNTTFDSPFTSGDITTSANCVIVAGVVTDSTTAFTVTAPGVERYENEGSIQDPCFAVQDRVDEQAGTYDLAWTGTDVGYSVLIAAFSAAPAPPDQPVLESMLGQFDADVLPKNVY